MPRIIATPLAIAAVRLLLAGRGEDTIVTITEEPEFHAGIRPVGEAP